MQPHGVLFALDLAGVLTHVSRNAARFFTDPPQLGQRPTEAQLWHSPTLREAAEGLLEDAALASEVPPLAVESRIAGVPYDVVLHATGGRVLLEFEPRDAEAAELASFAVLAHRSMSRLKGRSSIAAVLQEAVATVSRLTGFDRLLAYRFHADDSGEIVAEVRADGLEPYLGRRFPAADIPVQARRLYVVNTLRLIADVNDEQAEIEALDPLAPPLDLSASILRSVSPIHIEYLKNINVAASMSISIVVGGRLWGLIACHHRMAHRVPYAVRMACDVLASVVAASVQVLLARAAGTRRAAAAGLRAALVEVVDRGDESPLARMPTRAALDKVIASDALLVSHASEMRYEGISTPAAGDLLAWLAPQPGDLIALNDFSSLPAPLREALRPLSGLLAMRHDRVNHGWIVLLRDEQTAGITWSGPPDKVARIGPLGARLTPDGSLAEWRQEVSGCAAPWDELDLSLAREVMDEVNRAAALRASEMDGARTHLLAILGHDLRDPLHVISIAAAMLQRGSDQAQIGRRISATTGRMSRLITQVLDMSRLHGGLGLGLQLVRLDLAALLRELVDESMLTYPLASIEAELPARLEADVDGDRMAQVVGNLLANARQHGARGEPIAVRLTTEAHSARLVIANVAAPLGEAMVASLFDPLKRGSVANRRNPNGLGLGLYIAHEAIKGHRGRLSYGHDGRQVLMTVELPLPV